MSATAPSPSKETFTSDVFSTDVFPNTDAFSTSDNTSTDLSGVYSMTGVLLTFSLQLLLTFSLQKLLLFSSLSYLKNFCLFILSFRYNKFFYKKKWKYLSLAESRPVLGFAICSTVVNQSSLLGYKD